MKRRGRKMIKKNEKLETVLKALYDKKGVNITAFDVERQSGYTDFMVFVTGTSTQHNITLSDGIMRALKDGGYSKPLVEGETSAKWILVDAGDIVVNVMLEELRDHYGLEDIWAKCERVDVSAYISE
jgi:ribosome-associated protein